MSKGHFNASMQARATREAASNTIRYQARVRDEENAELQKCIEDLPNLDHSSLHRKSDVELAEFQASHPPLSPQYALAVNEWNRRLIAKQVRATQFAACLAIAGVILGWVLGSYRFEDLRKDQADYIKQMIAIGVQEQADDNHQGDEADRVSPGSKGEPMPNGQP